MNGNIIWDKISLGQAASLALFVSYQLQNSTTKITNCQFFIEAAQRIVCHLLAFLWCVSEKGSSGIAQPRHDCSSAQMAFPSSFSMALCHDARQGEVPLLASRDDFFLYLLGFASGQIA